MREILFKGKRIDNGEWVEGFYYKMSETTYCFAEDYERNPVPEHHYILQERMTDWGLPNQIIQIEVDPESICQFTGLCDKSGNKIWENDILKYEWGEERIDVVEYQPPIFTYSKSMRWSLNRDEVIGNIFDNPELLQEEHK